jgi:hypothetical protein
MIGHRRPLILVLLSIAWLFFDNFVIADEQTKPTRTNAELASTAGMLLKVSTEGEVLPWCTVSLTRPDTVLVAYHCVTSTHADDTLEVFFPYEGLRKVDPKSIEPFCLESLKSGEPNEPIGCSTWIDDLVVLRLSAPYSLLQPIKLGQASSTGIGSKGGIVGFGLRFGGSFEYGVKHEGEILLDPCKDARNPIETFSADQGRTLCFRFDWSNPEEIGIGPFDSGGPLFYVHEETGEKAIIGVARGSRLIYSTTGDERIAKYVNLTNPFYQKWLAEEVFAGGSPTTFAIEKLSTDEVQNLKPVTKADFTFNIKERASRLILTLNHEPGPSMFPNNLDLKLPASLQANCDRYDSVEVCSVENPAAGTYQVSVVWGKQCRSDGQCTDPIYDAAYQMTAIALYDNPFVSTVGNTGARNKQSHNE